MKRTFLFLLVVAACSGKDEAQKSVPLPPGSVELPPPPSSVIAVHVAGLDPELVDRGIREDFLPHLRRLRVEGTVIPLGSGGSDAFWTGRAAPLPAPAIGFAKTLDRIERPATDRLPEQVPVLEFPAFDGGIVDGLAQAGYEVIALNAPPALVAAPLEHKRVFASRWPSAALESAGFHFVREIAGEPTSKPVPGGRVIETPPTSQTEDSALFLVELEGPRVAPDAPPARARLELKVSKDRMRGEARTRDAFALLHAGRFSDPVRVRFDLSDDLAYYGRVRVYLRPHGLERLEAYVEPVEFDPILPPEWIAIASPSDYAAKLERAHGVLPRLGAAFPRAALDAGLLDARDAAAALDSAYAAERSLLSALVAVGGFRALFFETTLVDDARWFATLPPPAPGRDEKLVEIAGQRVPLSRVQDAVAGAVDRVIGELLVRLDKRERRESISLLVAATAPDESTGLLAMSRLAYDVEPGRSMLDVPATVAALLEAGVLPGLAGTALPVGNPMERLVEIRFEEKPADGDEPEDDGDVEAGAETGS